MSDGPAAGQAISQPTAAVRQLPPTPGDRRLIYLLRRSPTTRPPISVFPDIAHLKAPSLKVSRPCAPQHAAVRAEERPISPGRPSRTTNRGSTISATASWPPQADGQKAKMLRGTIKATVTTAPMLGQLRKKKPSRGGKRKRSWLSRNRKKQRCRPSSGTHRSPTHSGGLNRKVRLQDPTALLVQVRAQCVSGGQLGAKQTRPTRTMKSNHSKLA